MAIVQECPVCHNKQSLKRKVCKCGTNLDKEKAIPYSMTGGIFLASMGNSVVPEMKGKPVYKLNYRWPKLRPAYPMTCLIDELVQQVTSAAVGV